MAVVIPEFLLPGEFEPWVGKPPHPYERGCAKGHDTYKEGRYEPSRNCVACSRERNERYNRERRQERKRLNTPMYLPELKALRERSGYRLELIVWESGLDKDLLWLIEEGYLAATHDERVAIFQAFNVLRVREEEAAEVRRYQEQRRVWAGLA